MNFDFLTFLEIVNCDFAHTFSIESMHRHGGRVKISHVGYSCKSKKNSIFVIISKTEWNFGVPSVPVYGDQGLYRTAAKCSEISFSTRGRQFFLRGPFEGPLEIYC